MYKGIIMSSEKTYPRICLWCKEKGIHTIVGYSEIENSHGMCKKCKEEQRKAYYGKKEM
jgi:hypothetical protein